MKGKSKITSALTAFRQVSPCRWRLPAGTIRGQQADAEIIGNAATLEAAEADGALQQVLNVACLPGICGPSLAMPDIHQGYGFCIGAVAAFAADSGPVLPGGVGYDINCGVRLLSSRMAAVDLQPLLEDIGLLILRDIPTGLGSGSADISRREFDAVISKGAQAVIESWGGEMADLERIESAGRLPFQERSGVISTRARERGLGQLGSLGSGNHFIEIQRVGEIFDPVAAAAFGLEKDCMAVLIHSGSRGFGHQVATDYIELFKKKKTDSKTLPDPQLVYAPADSPQGKRYLEALNAAANFAWANRQLLQERVICILERLTANSRRSLGMELIYDQAHNIVKTEKHMAEGREMKLLVHRKGATRAFPAGHPELPAVYRSTGQPVILPGSMGTASYLLKGSAESMAVSFGSAPHGAGRRLSRHQAVRSASGRDVTQDMRRRGVQVFALSRRGLLEEIPEAYKDVEEVVKITETAGLAARVARLDPLLVVKG